MTEEKITFCRICEVYCGMIATVDDGRLVSLRPDRDHPLSAGFACQKGIAFAENDANWHHKSKIGREMVTELYAALE